MKHIMLLVSFLCASSLCAVTDIIDNYEISDNYEDETPESSSIAHALDYIAEAGARLAGMMGGIVIAAMAGVDPVMGLTVGVFSPEISKSFDAMKDIIKIHSNVAYKIYFQQK